MNYQSLTILLTSTEAATHEGMNWILQAVIISIAIGIVVGLIRAFMLKGQLTSVYRNDSAADYTREKSFKVELARDSFLYSKTEKKEKPQQNNKQ